tara:strand:+ start:755 stop:1426 length:672 start_codon:yes stop_codon:yes gene_type:complete
MQRYLSQEFQRGDLQPSSEMIEIKHIGPYLYNRLIKEFSRSRILTIRTFANRISSMSIDLLKRKLTKSLQNKRNNQCIPNGNKNNNDLYHVQDVNQKGYEILLHLIRLLSRNGDGHNLGANFQFDASRLRLATRRSEDAKTSGCLSRSRCRRHGNTWHDSLCQPGRRSNGFYGVHPYSGQKTKQNRNARKPLGSINNSIRRGRYARSPNSNILWRRPGRMRKV